MIRQYMQRIRRHIWRTPHKVSLLPAVVATVVVSVGVAAVAYIVIRLVVPVDVSKQLDPQYAIQFALWIAGGIGGVVALVVAYRRQKVTEESLFVERFGAAAAQLGNEDPAVRLAGAYAMAGVADESTPAQRQQCVDVLCAYLRLPHEPEEDSSGLTQRVLTPTASNDGGKGEETTLKYRLHDNEVRRTIIHVLASHLQPEAPISWSGCAIDLGGASLKDANFDNCVFAGTTVRFEGTKFSGDTSFRNAEFSANTSFNKAEFSGDSTIFDFATFSGRLALFLGATFSAVTTSFTGVTFSAEWTMFSNVTFSGGWTDFVSATFSGMTTDFQLTTFSGRKTDFRHATFSGRKADLSYTTYSAISTTFVGATFSAESTTFAGGIFDRGMVDFTSPKVWDPAPIFDWDGGHGKVKPLSVLPEKWPPTI